MENTMQLNPYLNFNGNCATAFRFYQQILGGTIPMMMTYRESPMCDQTLEGPLLRRRLHDAGVTMRRGLTMIAVEAARAVTRDEFDEPLELGADGIVVVTQRCSNDALYHAVGGDPQALAAEGIEAVVLDYADRSSVAAALRSVEKVFLLGPTVPEFYVYIPAYAQVRNEHVWAVGWTDIMQGGMKPEQAAEKAFKRVAEIFAKYPIT